MLTYSREEEEEGGWWVEVRFGTGALFILLIPDLVRTQGGGDETHPDDEIFRGDRGQEGTHKTAGSHHGIFVYSIIKTIK